MANLPARRRYSAAWRLRMAIYDHWQVAVAFALMAAIGIAVGMWTSEDPSQVVEEQAEVLRFGSHSTEEGNHPIVFIRLRDGSVRQMAVSRITMRQCRAGLPIRVLRGRTTLRISRMGCAPPAP